MIIISIYIEVYKKKGIKNMTELKLEQLHRGYVLTDFEGNKIGCKDSEQAIEEIKTLLKIDEKFEQPVVEENKHKTKYTTVELHRKIFEAAKEQISLTGKINGAEIARGLDANASNVHAHLKKLSTELDELIKKWREERDKQMLNVETRTDGESNKLTRADIESDKLRENDKLSD